MTITEFYEFFSQESRVGLALQPLGHVTMHHAGRTGIGGMLGLSPCP
jgi:hypothetical protein